MLDEWTEAVDRGKEVDVIYLDFRKAFVTVPHIRLNNILEQYGIRGKNLQRIEQFFKSKEQRVIVNQVKSLWSAVVTGVPQGSVVGPVLFLLNVNSIPDIVYANFFLYADDSKLLREISTTEDQRLLQQNLNYLHDWTKKSLLKFNRKKCVQMTLHFARSQPDSSRIYSINGKTLKTASSEKDLGVEIDEEPNFDRYVAAKTKKAISILGLIKKTFSNLTENIVVIL